MSRNFNSNRSSGRGQFRQTRRFNKPAKSGSRHKKAYIHPSKFVQAAKPVKEDVFVPKHAFADFAVTSLIKKNLADMGFSQPSPIQDQTIPLALVGRDVVGIANTGTGKTAAFAVPLLHKLITEPTGKALIMAPTRELAQQIEQQCRVIGKGSGLDGALLIGGAAMGPQLRDLRYNPRIIIGTPGRIKDHLERGSLDITDCSLVVLDEVDRMLDMGFVNDIKHIIGQIDAERQSMYFSATLDARVRGIIESFSEDPVHVSVKSSETSANVEQDVVTYTAADSKIEKLHDLLLQGSVAKTIVFDDTHRSVEKLSNELASRGFLAESIHGGKTQSQRERVLRKFKSNHINVLVATDVAARGLDVPDITHVVNYSQPQSYEDYVHRIGRTGRAGKVGYAFTFVGK